MNPLAVQRREERTSQESANWRPSQFATDVHKGLSADAKSLPAKYFYDRRGSELFEDICRLPEYYPTRTERKILRDNAQNIARIIGPDVEVVEFGAGAAEKVRLLLDALPRPRGYLPIDISGPHLADAVAPLAKTYPGLDIRVVAGDFTTVLPLPAPLPQARARVGFFPGSTIGNFTPDEALGFLRNAAAMLRTGGPGDALGGSGLLIGVDLVKDPAVLHAAYNDSAGVTAAFNLNLLQRVNRELGGSFDLDAFDHYAFYNPREHRIEMHLVSRKAQTVTVCDRRYSFAAGESIHTENSCKYTPASFRQLAEKAGFQPAAMWTDPDSLFSLHWLALPQA
jgi:dimethylhistidine N-methyltransferase